MGAGLTRGADFSIAKAYVKRGCDAHQSADRSYATSGRCFLPSFDSVIWTGEAISLSKIGLPPAPTRPKLSVPVGQLCTQAEQRTHSGSSIGKPLLAKL